MYESRIYLFFLPLLFLIMIEFYVLYPREILYDNIFIDNENIYFEVKNKNIRPISIYINKKRYIVKNNKNFIVKINNNLDIRDTSGYVFVENGRLQ